MHDDHSLDPTEHEAPHAHEGPGAPLLDHHVLATIRSVLGGPATARRTHGTAAADEVLDQIEQHFNRLDWLTGLSRRAIAGNATARQLLSFWLESHISPAGPTTDFALHGAHSHVAPVADPQGHDHHADNAPYTEPNHGVVPGINMRAMRELFLGTVYALGPDRAVRTGALNLVEASLGRSIGLVDVLHHYAVLTVEGAEHTETVPNLLEQLGLWDDLSSFLLGRPLPSPDPKIPPLLEINPILECLNALREGTVGARSAIEVWRDATDDPANLTGLIVGVSPTDLCAGDDVVLHADGTSPKTQFPASRPTDYGVFVEPCGTPVKVQEWTEDHITVTIPAQARSGCVTLGRVPTTQTAEAMEVADSRAVERFSGCLGNFGLGPQGIGPIGLNPQTFCRLTVCPPGSPNFIRVRHQPEIVSFTARDLAGRVIDTTGVEAGNPATISWEVRSDDTASLQVAISGAKTMTGLPTKGSLTLSAQDTRAQQSFTLEATNSCGMTTSTITVPVFRRLYLSPIPLSIAVNGTGTLTIRSSCPVVNDLTVTLATSNPDGPGRPQRVTVPTSATIPAGQDRTTISVSPALAGDMSAYIAALKHSQAASVVTATASAHPPAAVGVWVEPPLGQSALVSPFNTDVVAVHMALLHTGRVLMFSADDADFGHIDKVKTRVWDPATYTTVTPSFPYPTHKNLFCAGHCLLPDGRVLVVGGHSIFLGGAAAKEVHTFDPDINTWGRHAPMQKQRWYPTCVTLADGRALITSGSEGQGPPSIVGGVVRDVEIFDPTTNTLTNFPNIHGDIAMYPYMFVLPGGLLFFHSRSISWLFEPGTGTWSPTNGSWSNGIPMKGSSTRTYPGMAGCVLLPLLPEDGYKAKILMAGGGGAPEPNLNGSTVATRTAEIFDVNAAQNTGRWRDTDRDGKNPLLMTTFRFMSDGVLLPDGTVLFVNGAAVGKADDSHVSVSYAELFDPETETFRPLTSMSVPRHYHGTALLLPDGRVAVAGHTKEWNKPPVELNQFMVEVISPPYLFRGPRPLITQVTYAGSNVNYGQSMTVFTDRPAEISRVALIRPGTVTHQLNTDQRYVGLVITQRHSNSLVVQAPPDSTVAPPGYSLLFLVDDRGVPSSGHSLRIG